MKKVGEDQTVTTNTTEKDSDLLTGKTISENGDDISVITDEKRTDSDIDSDSTVSVLNYLNGKESSFGPPSVRSSSSYSDKSAIIRLNSELLRAKKSNWEVVDALTTAYDDIRDLRKREQRFNNLMRNNFTDGTTVAHDTAKKTEFKILNTQLEIREEELSKTKDTVRRLMGERDRLKDECTKTRADLQLLALQDKRKESELAVVQNNLRTLKEQQNLNDENGFVLKENQINLENQLRTSKNDVRRAEEDITNLKDTLQLRCKEISDLKNKLKKLEEENEITHCSLDEKESEIQKLKSTELAVFKEVENELASELTTMKLKLNEMQTKSRDDDEKIAEMTERLTEWERYGARMSKTMDEYIYNVNSKQLEARKKITKYVENLERQLASIKSGEKPAKERDDMPYRQRDDMPYKQGFLKARRKQSSGRRLPALQTPPRASADLDLSDSSISVGTLDSEGSAVNIGFVPSDEEASDVSISKRKGPRRSLPLTPSDIEALSDGPVGPDSKGTNNKGTNNKGTNNKGTSRCRSRRCQLPRRSTQDSGLGESLVGSHSKSRAQSAYPWRKKSQESKQVPRSSSPIDFESEKIGDDSDSFRTITPLSFDTGSPTSTPADTDESTRIATTSRDNSPVKRNQVPLRRFLSHDRVRAHRRHAALLLVFRYLTPVELCSLAKVCREWRSLSEHPSLWKNVALINTNVNNTLLLSISRRCKPLQKLLLKGLRRTGGDSREGSDNCYLERGLEYILKVATSSLLWLHIEDCKNLLTDRCLLLTGSHCRNLQSFTYISEYYPACPEALWALWNCRKLTCLRVPPMQPSDHPNRFNDKSCETIANCWPSLIQLSIGGTGITTTGLSNIAQGCLRLQELELDRTHYVTEETAYSMCLLGLKGLRVLMFTFTPVSPAAIKQFYAACPRLEYIAVHVGISDYFSNVTDPANINKYRRMMKKIDALREENLDLARVLRIKADYG